MYGDITVKIENNGTYLTELQLQGSSEEDVRCLNSDLPFEQKPTDDPNKEEGDDPLNELIDPLNELIESLDSVMLSVKQALACKSHCNY